MTQYQRIQFVIVFDEIYAGSCLLWKTRLWFCDADRFPTAKTRVNVSGSIEQRNQSLSYPDQVSKTLWGRIVSDWFSSSTTEASDDHEGIAQESGGGNNAYVFSVTETPGSQRVTVAAEVQAIDGSETTGKVVFYRA